MPIFFVLSGFLLFGPWVRALAEDRPPPVGGALRVAPGAPHHAGLRDHRRRRVRRVSLPHRRPQSRAHLDGALPQPDVDAGLHRQLPVFVSAPRTYADVEPGGGGRVLRGAAADGLPAARGAVPAAVATASAPGRPCCIEFDHTVVAGAGAHHRLAARRRKALAANISRVVHRRHDPGGAGRHGPAVVRRGLLAARVGVLSHRVDPARRRAHHLAARTVGSVGQGVALRGDRGADGGAVGAWAIAGGMRGRWPVGRWCGWAKSPTRSS